MEYFRDYRYPNGLSKSRLYDIYLKPTDFGVSDAEYDEQCHFVSVDERNNEKICAWFKDVDGKLVIADLQFANKNLRLEIFESGFRLIPKLGTRRSVKIFINYAREDSESAKMLFTDLHSAGFEPWIDDVSLGVGEKWKRRIKLEIRQSDYFVALLSSRSVGKKGHVQDEIRQALEILDLYPDNEIFVLPLRLDDCRPTHLRLAELTWVDLFPNWEVGIQKVIDRIKGR